MFSVAACLALIPPFGAEGAAAAIAASCALLFFSMYFFLYKRHYVRLYRTFLVYVRLVLITLFLYALHLTVLSSIHYIVSFMAVSALYAAAALDMLVTKDDIRVLRETVGVKWIRD